MNDREPGYVRQLEPGADTLNRLLDRAELGLDGALRRMRALLPDEDGESYELEREAFGIEDPKVIAAKLAEEERPEPPGPQRPVARGLRHWRELFMENWGEGRRKRRH